MSSSRTATFEPSLYEAPQYTVNKNHTTGHASEFLIMSKVRSRSADPVFRGAGQPELSLSGRTEGAHICTSLGRESASGSLTREPGSDIYVYISSVKVRLVTRHTRTSLTHWNPSPAGLASQTRSCMDTLTLTHLCDVYFGAVYQTS
jgi:hypothetical protein